MHRARLVVAAAAPVFSSADFGFSVRSGLLYAECDCHNGIAMWDRKEPAGVGEEVQGYCARGPMSRCLEGAGHTSLGHFPRDFGGHKSPVVVDLVLL